MIPSGWLSVGPPSARWTLTDDGIFTVRSCFRHWVGLRFPRQPIFPRKLIWMSLVPTKVCGFLWIVFHRNISTFENLARRGFVVPSICVLCRADHESVSHLFGSCRYTSTVWTAFSSKLAIHGPFEQEVDDFIIGWQDRNCLSQFKLFWKGLLHAVFWYIWGGKEL
ncbi:Putative ribonuclease H protein At1g65750 [Linum perenne]